MPIEEIEGYNEFQRDTKKIEANLPKSMNVAAEEFARQWVAAAQSRANTEYANQAAQMFTVSSSGDGATISNDSPVFFGSEFGGQGRPETMQFPPYNGRTGYWFYPARRENQEQLDTEWDKGIDDAMNPWNRHG